MDTTVMTGVQIVLLLGATASGLAGISPAVSVALIGLFALVGVTDIITRSDSSGHHPWTPRYLVFACITIGFILVKSKSFLG